MSYTLRPYQQDCHKATLAELARQRSALVVLPTGAGKSVNIAALVDACYTGGGRVLILSHVAEILSQNFIKIKALLPNADVGVYSAGLHSKDTSNQIIVASIQSVGTKAFDLGRFDLIVIDEAHLVNDSAEFSQYMQFLKSTEVINPGYRLAGYTATPYRLDTGAIFGSGPNKLFKNVCYSAEIEKLIDDGYLCNLICKEAEKFDERGARITAGEFNKNWLAAMMGNEEKVISTVDSIIELTENRKSVLIFCCDVQHCMDVAAEIGRHYAGVANVLQMVTGQGQGGNCAVITSGTPANIRSKTLEDFKSGAIKYLINCQVATTGMDAPNVDCVVMLRPTMSTSLYVQMVGRGFRIHPDKTDCLVLDFAGNLWRHGPIDEITIYGSKKRPGSGNGPTKECPVCKTKVPIQSRSCPVCQNEFEYDESGPTLKHDITPEQRASVLKAGPVDTEFEVNDVSYRVWKKKDDGSGNKSPDTMRVDYICGLTKVFSEWICIEHKGYGGQKARSWWYKHTKLPFPKSTAEALKIANGGGLAIPDSVVIREKPGSKYVEVLRCNISTDRPDSFDPNAVTTFNSWRDRDKNTETPKPPKKKQNPTRQMDFDALESEPDKGQANDHADVEFDSSEVPF